MKSCRAALAAAPPAFPSVFLRMESCVKNLGEAKECHSPPSVPCCQGEPCLVDLREAL